MYLLLAFVVGFLVSLIVRMKVLWGWDAIFNSVPEMEGEDGWTYFEQAEKVIEEAREFLEAADDDSAMGFFHMIDEMGDLTHACIVLMRMCGVSGVENLLEPVIKKNRGRGYYKE